LSKENKKRKRDDTTTTNETVPIDATTTTTKETIPETDDVTLPTDGRSLFVKNLSFTTTEEGLRNMFARCGTIRSVRIPKRRNPKYKPDWTSTTLTSSSSTVNPSLEWLSMGYGFVEYVNKEDAEKALRQLQGKMLDDHSLQLKLSTNKNTSNTTASSTTATTASTTKRIVSSSSANNAEDTSTATKLMVRNLAFEATKGDIQELFSSCGNIKTIRLPKKMDGHHRGFAFIEYLTHAEAASAMSTLASTHLYGRHLVIEWASQTTEHNGVGIASV
jgi:multiple RNA-binding domain-containing protein 1